MTVEQIKDQSVRTVAQIIYEDFSDHVFSHDIEPGTFEWEESSMDYRHSMRPLGVLYLTYPHCTVEIFYDALVLACRMIDATTKDGLPEDFMY